MYKKNVSMSCFHYCFQKTREMMGDAAVVGNPGPFWIIRKHIVQSSSSPHHTADCWVNWTVQWCLALSGSNPQWFTMVYCSKASRRRLKPGPPMPPGAHGTCFLRKIGKWENSTGLGGVPGGCRTWQHAPGWTETWDRWSELSHWGPPATTEWMVTVAYT